MSIKLGKIVLKPEIEQPKYWVHLGVILLVVYAVINSIVWLSGILGIAVGITYMDLTWQYFIFGIIALVLGDIVAHTLLKLD